LSALLHRSRPLYSAPNALRVRVMQIAELFRSTSTHAAVRFRKPFATVLTRPLQSAIRRAPAGRRAGCLSDAAEEDQPSNFFKQICSCCRRRGRPFRRNHLSLPQAGGLQCHYLEQSRPHVCSGSSLPGSGRQSCLVCHQNMADGGHFSAHRWTNQSESGDSRISRQISMTFHSSTNHDERGRCAYKHMRMR
jgi:hypothetical protein